MKLTQYLALQQKLAPQLIHSLQLLQLPTLELEQVVKQQLELNPLLEVEEESEEELEEESEEELEESADLELEETDDSDAELDFEFDEADWTKLMEGFELSGAEPVNLAGSDEEIEEDRRSEFRSVETMAEHLLLQLQMAVSSPEDLAIGETIIGSLDDRGYLSWPVEDIAEALDVAVEDVERVLKIVQIFDPSGIAARDLQECLEIQLREQGLEHSLAMEIVQHHFEAFKRRQYRKLCEDLGMSEEELREVEEQISRLNPKPGFGPIDGGATSVIPDLIVKRVDDDYVVLVNDRSIPNLRISPLYRSLLGHDTRVSEETKEYVLKRLNDARWLINSLDQRRSTMLKVMNAIVRAQREFFDKGPGYLKPMVLQDVADDIEMHPSTVSRVTNGKYVQTPHGIFELKYFFDNRLSSRDGGDVAAKNVMDRIRALIDQEDRKSPLSDQQIAEILQQEGIRIARRTVAKYRDKMRIPSARYRKAL